MGWIRDPNPHYVRSRIRRESRNSLSPPQATSMGSSWRTRDSSFGSCYEDGSRSCMAVWRSRFQWPIPKLPQPPHSTPTYSAPKAQTQASALPPCEFQGSTGIEGWRPGIPCRYGERGIGKVGRGSENDHYWAGPLARNSYWKRKGNTKASEGSRWVRVLMCLLPCLL